MKVVINTCFGGFGLSDKAIRLYADRKGLTLWPEEARFGLTTYWTVPPERRPDNTEGRWHLMSLEERKASNAAHAAASIYDRDIARDDADLVAVVEELGSAAAGKFADLKVVEIPDGVLWEISEYDGTEHVAEKHRTWGAT